MTQPVLTATGISKRFGPVLALRDVAFHVERGEIHALLGIPETLSDTGRSGVMPE